MSSQVLSTQVTESAELAAFARLMRAHTILRRELEAEVLRPRGLTINDFEALMHLFKSVENRLRRVDLVELLMLTPSGVTRLLDGLQEAGLVENLQCNDDARVTGILLQLPTPPQVDGPAMTELQAGRIERTHGHGGFQVRVGIHTGHVLLGGGVDDEGTIRGFTVNIAARLEQTAPPGSLRISQETWRHVRGVFDFEAQPPLQVKGQDEPLRTWLVLRAKPRAFRVATRGIEGTETYTRKK